MARMDFIARLIFGLSLTIFFATIGSAQSEEEALLLEESEDYFKKWLDEDVTYIITDEEKDVFQKLTSAEEKEQFIEQFWFRRDCGRVYIIQGPPVEINHYPTGTFYERPMHEGGGMTAVYPFETWRYRHLEGIGDDIVLEFVDKNMTGEYRLALHAEEKDALLNIDGVGLTLAESMGLAQKSERPWFSPGNRTSGRYPMMIQREQDSPFRRYETYAFVQRPSEIKYDDLKELVKINVQYDLLPFTVREDYFRLNDQQALVPVSVQLQNKDLSFKLEMLQYRPETFEQDLLRYSMYQRIVPVDLKLRYKLDLVIKDLNSGHMGVLRRAIVPPAFATEELASSSMILSTNIQVLEEIPEKEERFVLGDVKIMPSLQKVFSSERPLAVYLHVYNAALDQASYLPALEISYRLFRNGEMLGEITDKNGESTQYFSSRRVVLIKQLSFIGVEDGKYQLEVEVHDLLTDQRLKVNDDLTLVG
jgi:hypothetical protein